MKTNVPEIQFTEAGLQIPSEVEILEGVLADFNQAFGGGLNLNLETPQGQLASSFAAIIADKNNQIAQIVNQVHPDYADGFMQDAIAKIYFLERKQATKSVAVCTFMGLTETVIPKGFEVRDVNGNRWFTRETVLIGDGRTVKTEVYSDGQVEAKAGSINIIYQSLIGLDRVSNEQAAIVGVSVESREDFRKRRQQSVAINSHGTVNSVAANVLAIDGVKDVYVVDNPKGEYITQGTTNYRLKPHSIYVAAIGGNDEDIARTILTYAGNGCDFNGNQTLTIYDENYTDPKPSYEVSFMRPAAKSVFIKVTVSRGAQIGYQEIVKRAIQDEFKKHLKIGGTIYASSFFPATINALPDSHILNIEIGFATNAYGTKVVLGIDQYPVIEDSKIEVIAND